GARVSPVHAPRGVPRARRARGAEERRPREDRRVAPRAVPPEDGAATPRARPRWERWGARVMKQRRVAAVLVHHPVLDRAGEVVTTAITNLDLHDIARSAHTYGLEH